MPHQFSRRRFLQTSAAVAAGLALPGPVLAANDKINLAVIGVGGQGTYNLNSVAHENIVAL
jgi:hypothetical protein